MQSLEAACEEGERSIKKLKLSRSSLPLQRPQETSDSTESSVTKPSFCIFTKLLELYEELSTENKESVNGLKVNSLLLEKLVARERLNTLVLNLYPGNKGYSLAIRTSSRTDLNSDDTANMIETEQWPYEENDLLKYFYNEEIPPSIIEIFEQQFNYLFYSGCIIAEVRDYRQAYPHFKCDIHHVLLRPTYKSVLADINNIAKERSDWDREERLQLESHILVANSPTLCLHPDSSICKKTSEINNNKQMWNSHKYRRKAYKSSQVSVNKKRRLDQFTHRHGLELYDFITKTKTKPKTGHSFINISSKASKKLNEEIKPIPVPNLDSPLLNPPSQGVEINQFKMYQRPKETSDSLPQLIEEYVLETDMSSKEKGKPRVYHIKLSILQRPSTSEYLGELYLDRDHKKDERNGVACRFSLGSRANANRYIHQFTEIFTESGRKSVRIKYDLSPGYKERVAIAQAQMQAQSAAAQSNLAQQHLNQLSQTLQNQTPIANGTISTGIGLGNQISQTTSNVPILQSHLQGTNQYKLTSQQVSNQELLEINALAKKLMNCEQQYQATTAKQQQQKLTSSGSNTAIINLLNSSPASNVNSETSAAVVNAINSSSLLPQQLQTTNQKLLTRKMTLPNVANARVLNHSNLIALNNNNRMNLQELNSRLGQQQQQTKTLTTVNSGNFTSYTTVPIKQQINQRIITNSDSESSTKSALSALLVGTPAANRPDIVGPNTNSLLLEKLAGASNNSSGSTHFIQSPKGGQQFMVQSPKGNTVLSPMSSPPPQTTNTINVQSLNFAQLQSLSGLQNVQVVPVFAQPVSLSLNVSSTGNIQGHPTSLIVSSLPVTTTAAASNTITQAASNSGSGVNSIGVGTSTVVLANAAGTSNLAQLMSSGVKGISQQAIRTGGPQTLQISQGGQPIQLIAPLQRPRLQQTSSNQQNIASRTIQRTPITFKMAGPNANATQVSMSSNSSLASQLQKQAQLQQYQQLCMSPNVLGKNRRRSNNSDQQ